MNRDFYNITAFCVLCLFLIWGCGRCNTKHNTVSFNIEGRTEVVIVPAETIISVDSVDVVAQYGNRTYKYQIIYGDSTRAIVDFTYPIGTVSASDSIPYPWLSYESNFPRRDFYVVFKEILVDRTKSLDFAYLARSEKGLFNLYYERIVIRPDNSGIVFKTCNSRDFQKIDNRSILDELPGLRLDILTSGMQ